MSRLEKARQFQREEEQKARIAEQQKLDAEKARQAQINETFETSVKPALHKEKSEFIQKHIPPELFSLFEEVVNEIDKEHKVQLSKVMSFQYTGDQSRVYSPNHESISFENKKRLVKSWENDEELISCVEIEFANEESKNRFINLGILKHTKENHTAWRFGPDGGDYIPQKTDISELVEIFAKNLNTQRFLKPRPSREREWDGGDAEFGPSR